MKNILKYKLVLFFVLCWASTTTAQTFSAVDRLCQNKKQGRNQPKSDDIDDCDGDPCADNTLSAAIIVINCNGGSNGEIDLIISGMTAPITYAWSNGATSQDLTGLSAGDYAVVIRDADGCEQKQTYTLAEPDALDIHFSFSNESCPAAGDGNAGVFVADGTPGYTYMWSNGSTSNITGMTLTAGTYTCIVTDALGCTKSGSVTIGNNDCGGGVPAVSVDAGVDRTVCVGETSVLGGEQTAQGGNTPYAYNWSGPFTITNITDANPTISGLSAGVWIYTVTVTDALAATAVASVQVTVGALPSVSLVASSLSLCEDDGTVSLTGSPAGGTYSGAGVSGATFDPAVAGPGSHEVYYRYTDGNGCSGTASQTIVVSEMVDATWVAPIFPIYVCDPAFDMNTLVSGTVGGSWSGSVVTSAGLLDPSFGPGTFSITYQVGIGPCIEMLALNVTILDSPVASFSPIPLTPCDPAFALSSLLAPMATSGGTFVGGSYINGAGMMDPSNLLPGNYPVTYVVGEGICQAIYSDFFTIFAPVLVSAFSYAQQINVFELTDGSTNATSWLWDFGDGNSSILQNPIHSYSAEGVYQICLTVSDGCDSQLTCQMVAVTKPVDFVSLDIIVKLAGCADPSNSYLMNDDLRQTGLLPLSAPYTFYGYQHKLCGGLEEMDPNLQLVSGPTAPVDWIIVELRFKGDPTIKMASVSAVLLRNGQVVDANGNNLQLAGLTADDYYVVVKHRNHLGIMTATPLALNQIPVAIDFSDPATNTFGSNARYDVAAGISCLWAGDANFDGQVIYSGAGTDINDISTSVLLNPLNTGFSPTFPFVEYENGDLNMDGQVIYSGSGTDININSTAVLLNPANTSFSPTLPLVEQVPPEQ